MSWPSARMRNCPSGGSGAAAPQSVAARIRAAPRRRRIAESPPPPPPGRAGRRRRRNRLSDSTATLLVELPEAGGVAEERSVRQAAAAPAQLLDRAVEPDADPAVGADAVEVVRQLGRAS